MATTDCAMHTFCSNWEGVDTRRSSPCPPIGQCCDHYFALTYTKRSTRNGQSMINGLIFSAFFSNVAYLKRMRLKFDVCRKNDGILNVFFSLFADEEEDGGSPSCGDYIMHFFTFPWKFIFAFVPPTGKKIRTFFTILFSTIFKFMSYHLWLCRISFLWVFKDKTSWHSLR